MTLKLDNEFFWCLTPFEFKQLVDRYLEDEKRKDFRAGMVVAMIANVNRDSKKQKKPFQPSDFFTSLSGKQAPKKTQTPEDQYKMAEIITNLLG